MRSTSLFDRVAPAAAGVVLILALRGVGWMQASLALGIAATLFCSRNTGLCLMVYCGVAVSLLLGSSGASAGMMAATAVSGVILSDSREARILLALAMLALVLSGILTGILLYFPLTLVVASLGKSAVRAAAGTAGAVVILTISGLPVSTVTLPLFSEEYETADGVAWNGGTGLRYNSPVMLLESHEESGGELTIHYSAGGVRDTLRMGVIVSGSDTIPVFPGEEAVTIQQPEYPVEIIMQREWRPLFHPVIWILQSESGS